MPTADNEQASTTTDTQGQMLSDLQLLTQSRESGAPVSKQLLWWQTDTNTQTQMQSTTWCNSGNMNVTCSCHLSKTYFERNRNKQ